MTAQVTIVVAPRERFSYTRESLESIYNNTTMPFSLVYVDGNSPSDIRQYLAQQAQEKDFKLIRCDYYLAPNQARNIGLRECNSKYVVFIDNDVIVAPGWLENMVQCAEETSASVVGPLVCIGKEFHQVIHLAGGEARIVVEIKDDKVKQRIHEKHYFVNRRVAEVQDQLHRQQCEFAEFHCVLVRTEIFEQIGLLDEALLNTREHIDFCMTVAQSGGKIYCEPAAVVTYVPGPPFKWSDMHYFMLRWSDDWELASLQHFRDKWQLKKDKYFKKRYSRLGQRRHQAFVKPLVKQINFGQRSPWLENLLIPLERTINRIVTERYTRNHPATSQTQQVQTKQVPENQPTLLSRR